jgi:hypothetical protein
MLLPKCARRFTAFDDSIVALYARGLTVREIQGYLAEAYGTEVSPDLVGTVTDSVHKEVTAWQSRPLETVYPVVFFDALRVTAHLLLGGKREEMRAVAREAILQGAAIGLTAALAWTIEAVALYAAMINEFDTAAGLARYARGVHPSVATRAGSRKAAVETLAAALAAGLPTERLDKALDEGRHLTATAAANLALAVIG